MPGSIKSKNGEVTVKSEQNKKKTDGCEVKTYIWTSDIPGELPYPGADVAVSKATHLKKTKKGYYLNKDNKFIMVDYIRYKPVGAILPQYYVIRKRHTVEIVSYNRIKAVTKRNEEHIKNFNATTEFIETTVQNFKDLRNLYLQKLDTVQ